MPDVKLIHKSRKYADLIMQDPTENNIREVVLNCWQDAWQAAYEAAIKNYGNIREDMGR